MIQMIRCSSLNNTLLSLLISCLSIQLYAQDCYVLSTENKFSADYKLLWTVNTFQGTIGNSNQRIEIRFTEVSKDEISDSIYHVKGKSKVNSNICDFKGEIILKEEYLLDGQNPLCEGPTFSNGYVIGEYLLKEDPNQNHVGVFEGNLKTYFYFSSDGPKTSTGWYTAEGENEFIGSWQEYGNSKSKYCAWGLQIPPTLEDDLFEHYDNEAYIFNTEFLNKGWKSYVIGNLNRFIVLPKDFFFDGPRYNENFINSYTDEEIKQQREIEKIEWWE